MASDKVWQELRPKLSNGRNSSNLSQISSFSIGNMSLLSLTCRVPAQCSSQAQQKRTTALVSSPKTPKTKQNQQRTPKSTPKQRTPMSTPKQRTPTSSTRKKLTPDGFTQKKIDCYFESTPKKITTPLIESNIEIVELTSDSSEDEDASKTIREECNIQSHTMERSSKVSRVLFSDTPQKSSSNQVVHDNNSNVRGKENINEPSCSTSKSKESEKILTPPTGIFLKPQTFTYKVAKVTNLNRTVSQTKSINGDSEVRTIKDKVSEILKTTTENVVMDTTTCAHKSSGSKNNASKRLPDLDGNKYSVQTSQGKNKLIGKKNVEIGSIDKNCNTKSNTEHFNDHSASTSKDSQSEPIAQMSCHSFNNFTGVTECVSLPSSGEMWTPSQNLEYPISDSDDFENEKHTSKPKKCINKKKVIQKVLKKNVNISKSNHFAEKKSKGKSPPTASIKVNNAKEKRIKKSLSTVLDKETPCTSKTDLNKLKNSSVEDQNIEREDFTLSGGFFHEENIVEKPKGQAFVIRSPSEEYLVGWGDLMEDSSITVEHENFVSESEGSSVLADISTIDQLFDESMKTPQTVIKSKNNNVTIPHLSAIEAPKESSDILPYQAELLGVSLSATQWNNLACQPGKKSAETVIDSNPSKGHFMNNSCDVIQSVASPRIIDDKEGGFLEGYNRRASSPHEAEKAPYDRGFSLRGSHKAQQPETSPEKAMIDSHVNYHESSNSSDIGYLPEEKSDHENSFHEELSNSERVLEWISQIPKEKSTKEDKTLEKNVACKTKPKQQVSAANNTELPNLQQRSRKRGKPCDVKCQVKVFIKSNTGMSDAVIKNVKRIKCIGENVFPDRGVQKTVGVLYVEVNDISNNILPKNLHLENSQRITSLDNSQSSMAISGCTEILNKSHSIKKIPIKVEVKYGKWGWENVEIDCVEVESCRNSKDNVPVILCIQEVDINICNCSRHMQVNCMISKGNMLEAESVHRSRYHTSLKNHISYRGLGDNPLTLTVVAYSKLCNSLSDNSTCSSTPFSEKDTVIYPYGQDVRQPSTDSDETVNLFSQSTVHNQQEIVNTGISKWTVKERKTVSQDSESEEIDTTPAGFSDDFQEWMTPPLVPESIENAADKWKHIMQRMRSGESSSTITSSTSSASSLSSVTSQGTLTEQGGWGRRRYTKESKPKTCPFYKLIQGTRFAVDAFSYGAVAGVTHYFLSHFHYDHYIGLTKKFAHPIYCSSVTAKLVAMELKVNPTLLKTLDPGQTIKVENTKVTALDANHCPGSVMFLFELPDGRNHLHVGDFRAHHCMESYHPLWNVDIDRLHLDTTYCDPTYNFPSQQEVIKDILTIVEAAVKNDPKTLIVCGSYTIGKERVFSAIAEDLKAMIWAPSKKFKVLQCVKEGLQDLSSFNSGGVEGGAGRELGLVKALMLLTTAKEDAQVHVLPMTNLKRKFLEDHLYSIKGMPFRNVIAFRPTGWTYGQKKGISLFFNSPVVKIYEAAYSEHSSFSEMARFVKFIKPKQVIKTVNVGSPRKRQAMDKHIDSWLAAANIPNKNNESPKSAQVLEEQRKAGLFNVKSGYGMLLSKTKALHALTFSNSQEETSTTQTSLNRTQSPKTELHLASRVAIKRTCSPSSGEPYKKQLR